MKGSDQEHFDPSLEITLETVRKRAVKGVVVLTGRTLALRAIAFVAQGFLWAFLEPAHFGTFLLVSSVVNFLSYFADIGLGAALIQKKDKPREEDFTTVFLVQEMLVGGICLTLVLLSPFLAKTYSLGKEGIKLLYALTFAFFLASLKNIPSIILERRLEFGKFIIPQIVEDLVYNVSVVYFAWRGLGITSFTYAVLIRGLAGILVIYILQPWRPGISFSKDSLKGLLSFGIPYQLNNFLASLKDDGLIIVLGGILGSAGLGILGTAQKASQYPLRFFMDNVTKVTFPAFSRMQESKSELSNALTKSVFFICSLVFPSLFGLVALFPLIIEVIPRYQKWEPAYLPLIFLSGNSLIAAFTTQFTNILNAIGKIKITFKLMIMWTVLSWVLVPWLSYAFGVNGASFAYFLVSLSSFVVYVILRRFVDLDVYNSIFKPFLASFVMGTLIFFFKVFVPRSAIGLLGLIILGSAIYALAMFFLVGVNFLNDVKRGFQVIFKKS